MTIGSYIVLGIITVGVIVSLLIVSDDWEIKPKIIGFVIAIVILAGLWGFGFWLFNNTESGKRALKTQDSNLNGGIKRKVAVYDIEGDIIAEYQGSFDIEYDDDRILFDDENGLRHIIYYPTGTVVIDEVEKR